MARHLIVSVLLLGTLTSLASAQTPVGTAFTYQGRLNDAGVPADGTYDLRFVLFDAAVAGAQVGPVVTRDDVVVTGGFFVGIVPVKASAEAGPIRPGDRLVASATPGHAMRSAKEVRVGSVIGKALSALEAGTGTVRMLVVLQ